MVPALSDRKLDDEAGRLAALERYRIMDSAPEQRYDRITALVCTILDAPICAVSLIDRDRQWFKSVRGLGTRQTQRSAAFCDHTIRGREPMMIADAVADPRFTLNPLVTAAPGIRSYLGVPLVSPDGYNLGALCVIDTQPREFTEVQREILSNFAGLVMDEIELRTIMRSDFLTGALSRRAFVEAGQIAVEACRTGGACAALLMLDIDHFKAINDGHGHPVGDRVLVAISQAIQAQLRPEDRLGRIGGEEFGVLMPGASAAQAFDGAERLRLAIAGLAFESVPELAITASFGLAMAGDHPDFDHWIAGADSALYRAKRAGRNMTVAA